MDEIFFAVGLALLGLVFGSSAGATVWRLRARQLIEDKRDGELYDKAELRRLQPLTKGALKDDRSRCLSCGHELRWYDLIPLVSWVSTRGKCRYCHHRIGWFEPLMELGTAVLMVGLFVFWPYSLESSLDITELIGWLVAAVLLVVLLAYDLKWFLLPNVPIFLLMAVGAVVGGLHVANAPDALAAILSIGGAIVILSGIYAALWFISRGKWIGFGDVKLGLGLALLLADWRLAFIALFLANFIGTLIVLPGMMSGKVSRSTRIPFGPLLIIGTVLAFIFGGHIINWYTSLL